MGDRGTANQPTIRYARPEDVPTIIAFLKAGAADQKHPDAVQATEAKILSTIHLDTSPAPGSPSSSSPNSLSIPIPPTSPTPTSTNNEPSPNRKFAWALLIISPDGEIAGQAVWYYNYSTWLAEPGILLEELFVLEKFRSLGYAALLIEALAREARRAGCFKLDWLCYKDNHRALRFYEKMGAKVQDSMAILRVDDEGIAKMCGEEKH